MNNFIRVSIAIITGLILLAIAKSHAAESQIVDGLDWVEITTFPVNSPEYKNSLAVGEIRNGNNEVCNGTHIGGGIVLTANHCDIPPLTFRGGLPCVRAAIYSERDIAFLKCELPGDYPSVTVGKTLTKEVYLLELNCDFLTNNSCRSTMKYAPGVSFDHGPFVYYTADSLAGSSGAPLFNSHHEMIAVHGGSINSLNIGGRL